MNRQSRGGTGAQADPSRVSSQKKRGEDVRKRSIEEGALRGRAADRVQQLPITVAKGLAVANEAGRAPV